MGGTAISLIIASGKAAGGVPGELGGLLREMEKRRDLSKRGYDADWTQEGQLLPAGKEI